MGSAAFASVPDRNLAEIVDGRAPLSAFIAEYKKGEKLEITTKDYAAAVTAEWNQFGHFYQIILHRNDLWSTTLVQ